MTLAKAFLGGVLCLVDLVDRYRRRQRVRAKARRQNHAVAHGYSGAVELTCVNDATIGHSSVQAVIPPTDGSRAAFRHHPPCSGSV